MDSINTQKLEFHYYFNDDSHIIDANVRHKCETEILAIINEIGSQFKIDLKIEIEVSSNGGFIDRYKITTAQLSLGVSTLSFILACITAVMSRYPASTLSPELEAKNMEIADLTIAKLKREAAAYKIVSDSTSIKYIALNEPKLDIGSLNPKEEIVEDTKSLLPKVTELDSVYQQIINTTTPISTFVTKPIKEITVPEFADTLNKLQTSPKVNRLKSNLFNNLKKYKKVTSISTTPLNEKNEPIETPLTIIRENFSEYVIDSDNLPDDTDNNALIDIISPVLKGKYKWKGMYQGEIIDFMMKDKVFKLSVLKGDISFISGIAIECILKIKKRIDELGNIKIVSYSAVTVTSYISNGNKTETQEGKKIRIQKKADADQTNLNFDVDFNPK